jgi:hypothetical protein
MTIGYTIEKRKDYIYLEGEGIEDSLEENKQIHQMIVNVCKNHQCERVLIDDRKVTYTASIISLYQLAEYYAKVDMPRQIKRAAILASPKYKETNDFFEDTSRNRGINLRLFYDLEKAEQWLTAQFTISNQKLF